MDIGNPQTNSPNEYTVDNSNSLDVDRLFVTLRQVRSYGGESVGCVVIPYGQVTFGSLKDSLIPTHRLDEICIGEWLLKG